VNATNLLVGNYNIPEHNTYKGLRHGRLNHVFELAGVLCQPHPEPIVQKHKPAVAAPAPAPRKTLEKWKHVRGLSQSGTQTSMQELALAKTVRPSKKFTIQSSWLSIAEKTSSANVKGAGKKTSSASAGGSDATHTWTHILDLFDSSSSASDSEPTAPTLP
jgi:hypothetical protein